MGYIKNGSKVSIRTSADGDDIWKAAVKSDKVTLWCYGISSNETSTDDDSNVEIKHQSKKRKVSALQEKNKWIHKQLCYYVNSTVVDLLPYNIVYGQNCLMWGCIY